MDSKHDHAIELADILSDHTDRPKKKKMIDLDIAFDIVGGYGRFQALMTVMFSIWRNAGAWCFYCFAYLSLQ